MKQKTEIRTMAGIARPMLSEGAETAQEGRTISGYAIVFNQPSKVLCDGAGAFIETISRTALTEEKLRQWDIRALLEHNPERLLARWRQGDGTLTLAIDEVGLRYSFTAPDTEDGRTAVELVRRGDIVGSSFAYLCDESTVEWGRNADGTPTRRVNDITYMEDVSIVSRPAYDQTSVNVRMLEKCNESDEEAKFALYIKRARHDAEKAVKIEI